jgi:MFS family permease
MGIIKNEKRTFLLHLLYSIFEGIIAGALILNEFVFIKSLKGTDYQLSYLFAFSMAVLVFSIITNEIVKRASNKKRLLRIIAIVTRLPLLFLLFFPKTEVGMANDQIYHFLFLIIFLIYFLASPFIYPTINLLLKTNYRHKNFGKLFGYASSAKNIVLMISTLITGYILDINNFAFVYIYPFLAILGIISIYLLTMINYNDEGINIPKVSFSKSLKNSLKSMVDIIKINKPYRDFEIGFMFYGFSFMITVSVINIFFEEVLHLNYSSVAFYKNTFNIISVILLPIFGKVIGKIDPRKFAVITFVSLALYFILMGLTEYIPNYTMLFGIKFYYLLFASFIFYGVFASTMGLLWSIGSAYFCKADEAAHFQSIHLSLTGVRAMIAPMLGIFINHFIGYSWTFTIAIVSLLFGIFVMYVSVRKERAIKR